MSVKRKAQRKYIRMFSIRRKNARIGKMLIWFIDSNRNEFTGAPCIDVCWMLSTVLREERCKESDAINSGRLRSLGAIPSVVLLARRGISREPIHQAIKPACRQLLCRGRTIKSDYVAVSVTDRRQSQLETVLRSEYKEKGKQAVVVFEGDCNGNRTATQGSLKMQI